MEFEDEAYTREEHQITIEGVTANIKYYNIHPYGMIRALAYFKFNDKKYDFLGSGYDLDELKEKFISELGPAIKRVKAHPERY